MTLHATWFNPNNWFQSKFNWLSFKFLNWIQKHWMEFNLIWRGETKIDAKSIENLLAISNICDYGVEKKGLLRKNTNTYLRMHLFIPFRENFTSKNLFW